MLDWGNRLDWFVSKEILIEAAVAIICFYIFTAHILTSRNPYLNPWLLKDRNYLFRLSDKKLYVSTNTTLMNDELNRESK